MALGFTSVEWSCASWGQISGGLVLRGDQPSLAVAQLPILSQAMFQDAIITLKALVVLHRILREPHPQMSRLWTEISRLGSDCGSRVAG